jgi:hypothetical protein
MLSSKIGAPADDRGFDMQATIHMPRFGFRWLVHLLHRGMQDACTVELGFDPVARDLMFVRDLVNEGLHFRVREAGAERNGFSSMCCAEREAKNQPEACLRETRYAREQRNKH